MADKKETTARGGGVIHIAAHGDFSPGSARPEAAGGGNGGGMSMDPGIKHYIDSGDEVTRAQNDARFAEILAKLSQAATAEGLRNLTVTMVIAIVATGIGIIGIMIALFAFGADRFGSGMSAATLIYEQSDEAKRRAVENERNIKEIRDDIKMLIETVGERNGGGADAP